MILITGAAGMVGSHTLDCYDPSEVRLTDIDDLDVRNIGQVMAAVAAVHPWLVIHLAAETDVDRCQLEVDHAYRTNTVGTMNVALACQRYDAEMVYVSTLGVFDGSSEEPYTEFERPAPVNVYARTKWEGEKVVQGLLQRYYTVRAGWIFGGKEKDRKFVGKIAALCLNGVREILVVRDKTGSPTFARDLMRNIKLLTEKRLYGLYHMANRGFCTRYELAQEIARITGGKTTLVPVSSDAFPLPAARPNSEAGRNYKLELVGLDQMRHWKPALEEYMRSWNGVR